MPTANCQQKKVIIFFLIIVFAVQQINAQNKQPFPTKIEAEGYKKYFSQQQYCGFDRLIDEKRKEQSFVKKENDYNNKLLNRSSFYRSADTIIIPVVVHIISYFPDAISDVTIMNKIKQMEDGFAKRGAFDSSRGVDTKIRFCLAHQDPDGGITSGITREKSFFGSYLNPYIEDNRLKNLNQWNPDEYCNIWYINSMEFVLEGPFACGEWSTGKAIAYATLPAGGPLDGIVIPEMASTDVWCHEMGHYLGLYHTFSKDCKNNDCQVDGDKVCDTPPDKSVIQSGSCKNMENSCRTDSLSGFLHDTTDFNDNFMDYGRTCIGMFTNGQKDRMINSTFAFRSGLLNPKCDYLCTSNAVAYFTKSIAYPVAGDFVTFNNQSTNATVYKWYLDDVLVGTGATFSYTFANQGKFKVALHAYANVGDSCFSSYIAYVIINCGVTARFYSLNVTIGSLLPNFPDSITFINTSVGATNFEWYYYGPNTSTPVFMGNQKNITYIFPDTGAYAVYLVAKNGPCTDITSYQPISVLDPIPDGVAYAVNMHCYKDSGLQFGVRVCNSGYARIKKRIPISFYEFNPLLPNANLLGTYYTDSTVPGACCADFPVQTLWYNHTKYKSLYIVFNDSGHIATPFVMNMKNTFLIESNYANNVTLATNEYNIAPNPALITNLVPYDVVTIHCNANENTLDKNFTWSPALNLSCTKCQPTDLTIDSNRIKQVIAVSEWGCRDTDFVKITIPPHNDLTATISSATCYYNDSIDINFKIRNYFKRGKILKNTTVAFYTSNPTLPGAMLMPPIFNVPVLINDTVKKYNTRIKNLPTSKIWVVINDTNLGVPIQLPSTWYIETNYLNNIDSFDYENNKRNIIDTNICQGKTFYKYFKTGRYVDTFLATTGCDSFRIINLKVIPRSISNIYDTICIGDTLYGYFKSGKYFDTLVASTNCDSVRILHLVVGKPTYSNYTESICEGKNLWGYSTAGTYYDTLVNVNRCDSFRVLHLSVNHRSYFYITDTICAGDTVMGHYKTGVYFDTIVSVSSCDSIVVTNLTVNPIPNPKLGNDKELCYTDTIKLYGGKFVNYLWSTGSTDSVIRTDRGGTYWLMATNKFNCISFDTINVYPVYCRNPLIPNIFSPNGDNVNDTWVIPALKYFNNPRITIFNRNGQVVFVSTMGYKIPWTGTYRDTKQKLPVGTYYYVIELTDINKKIGGNVTIVY